MVLIFDALGIAALTIAGRSRARDEAEVVAEGKKRMGSTRLQLARSSVIYLRDELVSGGNGTRPL